jgi:Protein of unknown function (DUF2934)
MTIEILARFSQAEKSHDCNQRSDCDKRARITSAGQNIGGNTMLDEFRLHGNQQPLELIPGSPYESRREFVEKLAHKNWEERGRPVGSPDVDWFAAENAVYASLVASGVITRSSNDPQKITSEIYHWMRGDSEGPR